MEMKKARRQKEAVEEFYKYNFFAMYDYHINALMFSFYQPEKPPGPSWLRNLLGDDFFCHVALLTNSHTPVTDTDLKHLKDFPQLQEVFLGRSQVTDAGLEYLEGLSRLQWLDLTNTRTTDAGVKKLQQALPNCKITR